MRILILVAALALASCGGNEQANNSAIAEGGESEVTAVNDTTAIDAATGEAANMAADVNYMFNEESANGLDNNLSANQPAAKKPATARPSRPAATPADDSATETNSL